MHKKVVFGFLLLLNSVSQGHAQWVEKVAAEENGLDKCAGTIALELDKRTEFRPDEWPIFCHQYRDHPLIQKRVEEIRADVASERYTEAQRAALRADTLPIGAPREAAFYLYGSARSTSKKTTAEGVTEVIVFKFLDGNVGTRVVTVKAGIIDSLEEF